MGSRKFKAIVSAVTMQGTADEASKEWAADGCSGYSIHNAGNVNVTIDGVRILKPRETWVGPAFHPEVSYFTKHRIEWDRANAPAIKTPVGGIEPPSSVVNPGDPVPGRDFRVIIDKINVE